MAGLEAALSECLEELHKSPEWLNECVNVWIGSLCINITMYECKYVDLCMCVCMYYGCTYVCRNECLYVCVYTCMSVFVCGNWSSRRHRQKASGIFRAASAFSRGTRCSLLCALVTDMMCIHEFFQSVRYWKEENDDHFQCKSPSATCDVIFVRRSLAIWSTAISTQTPTKSFHCRWLVSQRVYGRCVGVKYP